jgi:hypothetical protein
MSSNARRAIFWLLALVFVCATGRAQETDTTYALIAYGGAGYTRNLSTFDITPQGLQQNGFGGTLRIMWKPEHLLRLGIETGLTQVYQVKTVNIQSTYGATDFTSSLNAVPILLAFSMPLTDRLEVILRSGGYLLYSNTESFGNTVSSSTLSTGFGFGLSYMTPLDEDWGIGGEIKWYHMSKFDDDNIMLQVMVSYNFLEW